jgi:hypothetical protein
MTLEELAARTEIHDVLLRYCRGLDRIDMSLVRGAFHKDAYIHFPESLHVGGAEGFFQFLTDEMPRFNRTQHFLGNSLIEFDGPETAYVETVKLWARYFDRFERRDGVWLIAERRLMVDLMYRYPNKENWFDDHPDASGSPRDGTDRALRKVAGFSGTPIAEKSLKDA